MNGPYKSVTQLDLDKAEAAYHQALRRQLLDSLIEQVRTMPPNGVISRWESVSRTAVIDLLLAARGRDA